MACTTPCSQCAQTGLPILFTRYAAAYGSTNEGMVALQRLRPVGHFHRQPGGVALKTAIYNLRMLRAGYLYIRMKSPIRQPEWLAYVVHPHGYLTRFDFRHPEDSTSLASCSPAGWGANRSLVWIKDANDLSSLHYMFNPDPIDPDHLQNVIEADIGKFMQRFDIAGWARGKNDAPHTAVPTREVDGWNVAEFRALHDKSAQHALEPQIYGLMGSSAIERGWGNYQQTTVTHHTGGPIGETQGLEWDVPITATVEQLDYAAAHGPRLRNIAKFLADNNGAIVACDDAIGIAQELGHLQAEAQVAYTRWQASQASGAAKGVTNEWVHQTAMAATNLRAMLEQGLASCNDQAIDHFKGQRPAWGNPYQPGTPEFKKEKQRVDDLFKHNQDKMRTSAHEQAKKTAEKAYAELFDQTASNNIMKAQKIAFDENSARLAALGTDHVAWLEAPGMQQAVARYSKKNEAISRPGGGAALSVQAVHCMAGADTNRTGQDWIDKLDPTGDNLLATVISYNNEGIKETQKHMMTQASPPPTPGAEPSADFADRLTLMLKLNAGNIGLGDKALAFADDHHLKPISESAAMRKLAWPLHVSSLMAVKMVKGVNKLPATEVEAWLIKQVALTGMSTMGSEATKHAKSLALAHGKGMDQVVDSIGGAAQKMDAGHAVRPARAAGVFGLFDLSLAILKWQQLMANPDNRTAIEMVGSILQSIGSLADFRAKAYEETIFKGVTGWDFMKGKPFAFAAEEVNVLTLKAMRLTAIKFLGAAALISVWWDVVDGSRSIIRGNLNLGIAQFASVAGTVFSVLSSTAAYLSLGKLTLWFSAATWGSAAAVLGLIGAVLVIGATIAIWWFDVPAWKLWLQDNPLSKLRNKHPIAGHADLKETLQRLASAMQSTGALTPRGIPI